MALMHTGLRQAVPEQNPGMGRDDAYEMALSLYSARRKKNKDLVGDVLAGADRHFARLFRRKCLELRTSARFLLVGRWARVISLRSFSLLPAWWDAKQQEQKKCETQQNDWYDQSV